MVRPRQSSCDTRIPGCRGCPWLRGPNSMMNRAVIANDAGRASDAIAFLERATTLRGVDRNIRIRVLERLADLELHVANIQSAAQHLSAALKLAPRGTVSAAVKAGDYAHRLHDSGAINEVRRFYDMGLRRAEAAGDPGTTYDLRSDRALLLADRGDGAHALAELEASLEIATKMRDRERKVRALHNIGELARRTGDMTRSLRTLRRACTLAAGHLPEAHRSASGLLAITQLTMDRTADATDHPAPTEFENAASGHSSTNRSTATTSQTASTSPATSKCNARSSTPDGPTKPSTGGSRTTST